MDKLMRAIVTIPRINGIPEDAVSNTWYFDGDDSDEDDITYHTAVMTLLTGWYHTIDGYMSQEVTNTATVRIYDMRDAEPRVPEFTDDIALTLSTAAWLPGEVAVCLSFQADPVSGLSQRRRRGRIYCGPIAQEAVSSVTGDLRPSSTMLATMAAGASELIDGVALPITGRVKWAVYSPTTDLTASVDDAFNDVTSGWIDNAFDIQRRRGASATLRTSFS